MNPPEFVGGLYELAGAVGVKVVIARLAVRPRPPLQTTLGAVGVDADAVGEALAHVRRCGADAEVVGLQGQRRQLSADRTAVGANRAARTLASVAHEEFRLTPTATDVCRPLLESDALPWTEWRLVEWT